MGLSRVEKNLAACARAEKNYVRKNDLLKYFLK
jgi:hypothetical protein